MYGRVYLAGLVPVRFSLVGMLRIPTKAVLRLLLSTLVSRALLKILHARKKEDWREKSAGLVVTNSQITSDEAKLKAFC